jgi:hypothetical protein
MGNGNISFEIEGVTHSLFFGMVATEMITGFSVNAARAGTVDDLQAFAYIIYGGLCNKADSRLEQRPEFENVYMIADAIYSDKELASRIYSEWENSKPCIEMRKKLGLDTDKKKAEEKPKRKTGTK